MIQHIVALSLRADYDSAKLLEIMNGLGALQPDIAGFTAFQHGANLDFEQKSAAFPYGFICTFENADALGVYAGDPRHRTLGGRLVALCEGGADGIFVMDLAV